MGTALSRKGASGTGCGKVGVGLACGAEGEDTHATVTGAEMEHSPMHDVWRE